MRSSLLGLLLILTSPLAYGFPEMVRHDYVNCTTCHVAQNGGGILTEYGRALSLEVLTTWGKEGEEQFLYGVVKPPKWLNLGGDIRAVQTYINNAFIERGDFITMQMDLEAAITFTEQLRFVGTIGKKYIPTGNPSFGDYLISRRHFLSYQHNDQISLRAGKFQFAYGINIPDHILQIKRGLLWDDDTETYNIEGSYIAEDWDLFVTANLGRIDDSTLNRERGVAVRGSKTFSERYKLGLSYFYGTNDTQDRQVFGPWGILGITQSFYILTELDFQQLSPNLGVNTFGAAILVRPAYEIVKGLHVFFTFDASRFDFGNQRTQVENYGPGIQFFPRPHFDIQLILQKARILALSNDFGDSIWLMGHFYL